MVKQDRIGSSLVRHLARILEGEDFGINSLPMEMIFTAYFRLEL